MSARTHPRLIGGFVLGAIALVLAVIVLLSSGGWFQKRNRFVVYFPGSVKGLQAGSEVTFRGVKIGEVIDVSPFQTGLPENPIQIEVACELYRNVVEVPDGVTDPYAGLSQEQLAARLIELGARARMMRGSLLTGQKYIEIEFMPEEPARLAGLSRRYPEIPTTPTAIEKMGERVEALMNKIAEVPLDQVVENVQQAIRAARELLESPDVKKAFASARRGADSIEPTMAEARATLKTTREVMDGLGKDVDLTSSEARKTLAELNQRLKRTETTFEALEATLRGADDARVDMSTTLVELEQALKAFRNLAEYIETHPEALLQGKQKEAN